VTSWSNEPEEYRTWAVFIINGIVLVLSLAVAIITLAALLGWFLGWEVLTGVSQNYRPIAPSSALTALALSCLVYVYAAHRDERWADQLLKAGTGILLCFLIWIVIHPALDAGPDIEVMLGPRDLGDLPIANSHMSPFALWSFLGLSVSIFALRTLPAELKRTRSLLATIPVAVFLVGLFSTLGYVHGSPLLYGGSIRPIAWPAAFSLLALSIALLASLAPEYWPMRLFVGTSIRATMMRWFMPTLVVSIVATDWFSAINVTSGVDVVVGATVNAILGLFVGVAVVLILSRVLGGRFDRLNDERARHRTSLELANKKLRVLGAMTRHDVKNQMTVLRNWMEIARSREIGREASEDVKKALDLAKAIDAQLDFMAVYELVGTEEGKWLTLSTELASGISGIETGGVSMEVKLEGVEVFADPMLHMVFRNLVVDTLMHGGKVSKIRIYLDRDDHGIRIVYEDDGVGIPLGDKERIFEKGFGRHTGYGLFLAREILTMTGMSMSETGVPSKGARFEIAVPEGKHRYRL
jgi:signal transduction histidine kinase